VSARHKNQEDADYPAPIRIVGKRTIAASSPRLAAIEIREMSARAPSGPELRTVPHRLARATSRAASDSSNNDLSKLAIPTRDRLTPATARCASEHRGFAIGRWFPTRRLRSLIKPAEILAECAK